MRWLWLVIKLMDTVHVYKFWLPGFQGELNEVLMSVPLTKQHRRLMGREIAFVQENCCMYTNRKSLCVLRRCEGGEE